MAEEFTEKQAKEFHNNKSYESMSFRERAEFQINQPFLCMPFDIFHEAVEKTIGRPVWTHEFGMNSEGIRSEIMEGKAPPVFQEILDQIPFPKEKQIILVTPDA